ncbi:MAG: hypothetical protein GY694_21215 [Gammaproteobacteria bacterium]|nr:hypothetical protein [Gammaproteobacteria bacterium]
MKIIIRVLIVCNCLFMISCTAFQIGSQTKAYKEMGWLKVDPNENTLKSGYKRLEMVASDHKGIKKFLMKEGMPDYLKVVELWRLLLAYPINGIIYEFDTHYPGTVIATHSCWEYFGFVTALVDLSPDKQLPYTENLVKVAIVNKDKRDRLSAVKGVTDEAALGEIALKANDLDVRRAAIKKITDPTLLNSLVAAKQNWGNPKATNGKVSNYFPEHTNLSLAKLIVDMAPPTKISLRGNHLVTSDWTAERSQSLLLPKVEILLISGADPNALHIKGYSPASNFISTSSTKYEIVAIAGVPGSIVAPGEGGLDLLSFCLEWQLLEAAEILKQYGAKQSVTKHRTTH